MAKRKKRKKQDKTGNSENSNKSSTDGKIYDDMSIQVLSANFEDGDTVGSYLRAGGKKSTIRAAVKAGSISLHLPDYEDH